MSDKFAGMSTEGNQVEGRPSAQDNPMHVYGSGDSFGPQDLPKGAEIMRKRAEPGEKDDNTYTETGGK